MNLPDPDFKVEAVLVCDRYSDFLRCTLPANKHLFDRIVVVTSAEDRDTQRICEFHHVECVKTDALNSRWNRFCKGAGINEGLSRLDRDAWVVHLDADIWLPPQTRLLLQNANLDPSMIYGIDRFSVKGYAQWDSFLEMPSLQHECDAYVHSERLSPGHARHQQGRRGIYSHRVLSDVVPGGLRCLRIPGCTYRRGTRRHGVCQDVATSEARVDP